MRAMRKNAVIPKLAGPSEKPVLTNLSFILGLVIISFLAGFWAGEAVTIVYS
jgi:hypothetical protein